MTNSTTFPTVLAVCGLVATLGSGCKQATTCAALGDCGGPVPVGDWTLTTDPGRGSCIEDLYIPPSDPRLVGGAPVPAARIPPPEPAVYDWCDLLITNSGTSIQTHAANFYSESAPVGFATVRIHDNGTWSAGITRTGTYVLDFPTICMREFGAMNDRPIDPMDMNGPKGNVCEQLQVPLRDSGKGNGSYQNTTCLVNPSDPGGCLCYFDVQETGGPSGNFNHVEGTNTIVFLPSSSFPQTVTYCNKGDTLQLTGTDGEYLFGTAGLRTLDLAKIVANCTDGKQGPGEDGVDCGGQCPTACPTPPMPMP